LIAFLRKSAAKLRDRTNGLRQIFFGRAGFIFPFPVLREGDPGRSDVVWGKSPNGFAGSVDSPPPIAASPAANRVAISTFPRKREGSLDLRGFSVPFRSRAAALAIHLPLEIRGRS